MECDVETRISAKAENHSLEELDFVQVPVKSTTPAVISSGSGTPTPKRPQLSTLPESHYSTLLPYQIPQVRSVLSDLFPPEQKIVNTIVDATAHIGGDAIHFANFFEQARIYAIDIDASAIDCLKDNIKNLDHTVSSRFTCITTDVIDWISRGEAVKADFYYFDPPWGGPNYHEEKSISLELSGRDISDVIGMLFKRCLTKIILLKIPRNFGYFEFKKNIANLGVPKLYTIRKPQKKSIAYHLVIINKIILG